MSFKNLYGVCMGSAPGLGIVSLPLASVWKVPEAMALQCPLAALALCPTMKLLPSPAPASPQPSTPRAPEGPASTTYQEDRWPQRLVTRQKVLSCPGPGGEAEENGSFHDWDQGD